MSNLGSLSFDAVVNDSQFMNRLNLMENKIIGLTRTATREGKQLDQVFSRLGQLAVGAFAFSGLSDLPAQILKVRGEFQQLEIAFSTMLKSGVKGQQLLAEVTAEAAKTPLSLMDVANGAKQLLAYGTSAQSVVKDLHMLGDVAAGVGAPLNDIVYLYGTLRAQGRAYATDIRQFASRGIGIYEELAKVLKINVSEVNKFVEDGKVGFKEVEQAFKNMTSNGGIFQGMLDAQAQSLLGLKEKLGSAWSEMLNDIGKQNQDLAADVFTVATEAVTHYQDVLDVLKILVATYGGYRAALVLVSTAEKLQAITSAAVTSAQAAASVAGTSLTAVQLRQVQATALLTRAQAALNGVMRVNPIILIGTALAALVTSYMVFKDEVTELKSAQELLADAAKDANTKFASQQAEVKSLVGIIQNQNIAESERLKAYNKLNEISPSILQGLDFEKAKTADLTRQVNEYLQALRKKIQLESGQDKAKEAYTQQADAAERLKKAQEDVIKNAKNTTQLTIGTGPNINGPAKTVSVGQQSRMELQEAIANKNRADKVVGEIEANIAKIYSGTATREELEATIARQERVMASVGELSLEYKNAEETLKKARQDLAKLDGQPIGETFTEKLAKAEKAGALQALKTIADTDDKLEALQKKVRDKIGGAVRGSQEKAQLDKLDADINYALGKRTKAQKEAEKVGPYGSISYWENVVRLAEEALSKTKPSDTAGIEKQKAIIVNAQAQLEEVRKATAIRSFEDEIEEKTRLYTLYTKWTENYGMASADAQFADLKKNGDSYLVYLNSQITKLETKQKSGTFTQTDATNLGSLLTRKDELLNKKSAIDVFTESLQKAEVESKSLGDYLSILKGKQAELNSVVSPLSADYTKKKEAVAKEVVKTEQQLKDQVTQFLINSVSSGEQELAIRRKYNDLRLGLDKQYNGKRTEAYDNALKDINANEQLEFEDYKRRQFEQSEAYRATTKVILEEGDKANQIAIERQRTAVAEAEKIAGKNSEIYKEAFKRLQELEKQAADKGKAGLAGFVNKYTSAVLQFGQALSQLGGEAGVVGDIMVSFASNISLISQAFDKSTKKADLYGIAIQSLANLYSAISSAAEQRRQKEEQYYRSVIGQQQQLNLLLNEEKGLRSKNDPNIFGRDFISEIKDSYDKLSDAEDKYQQSLKKLQEGRAKTGLQTVDDKATGLQIIGSGAAAGAAIGALAGGVGAVVGAAIGGIVGGIATLFGGSKKKADEFGSLLATYPTLIQKGKDGVDELNVSLATSLLSTDQLDEATKQLVQNALDWQKQIDEAKQAIHDITKALVGDLGDKLTNVFVDAFKNGTDAALEFKAAIEDTIETYITKLIYAKTLKPYLDKLGEEIEYSIGPNGDQRIDDDLARFFKEYPKIKADTDRWFQQAMDGAQELGFSILKNKADTKKAQASALSREVQGVTESTASVLAGTVNAMRIQQADTNRLINDQLRVLGDIRTNTAGISRTNDLLESMDRRLRNMESDGLRAKGGG